MDSVVNSVCRICGALEGHRQFRVREMIFGFREEFDYFECGSCGCLQIKEVPADLGKYYGEGKDYYSFIPEKEKSLLRRVAYRIRGGFYFGRNPFGALIAKWKPDPELELLAKNTSLSRSSRILDVGSGAGTLIYKLKLSGFSDLLGVDPFLPRSIQYGPGCRILNQSLFDLPREPVFDLIVFSHSLEHMDHQQEVMNRAFELLRPGGRCYISIPTASSWFWRNYRENWGALQAPTHFYLHTIRSLKLLSDRAGFRWSKPLFASSEWSFLASEQNRKDIHLYSARSFVKGMKSSVFKPSDVIEYSRRAQALNAQQEGDILNVFLSK